MANYNPNLVKIHRNYSVEEAARLYGVHKNTVSHWLRAGLPYLDERKPYLILGADLKQFLQDRRTKKKQRCNPDQMYCFRCKSPQKPAEGFVEYLPTSSTKGRLSGICSTCDGIINKYASHASLERYTTIFDLSISTTPEHINNRAKPVLNSDIR